MINPETSGIEQLREMLTQKDTHILKIKNQLEKLALEDGWQIEMNLNITVREQTAIRMLMVYLEDLEAERASIYKALEEAVKSLKIID